jgi:hypothetical protein
MQTSKNNVDITWALLQTTGGKDQPNIGYYAEIVANITTQNSERKDIWWTSLYANIHKKHN